MSIIKSNKRKYLVKALIKVFNHKETNILKSSKGLKVVTKYSIYVFKEYNYITLHKYKAHKSIILKPIRANFKYLQLFRCLCAE